MAGHRLKSAALVGVLAVLGCGSSDGGSSNRPSEPTPTPAASATPTPGVLGASVWATGGPILRSLDGGFNWQLVRVDEGLEEIDFATRTEGWAVGSTTILRTRNGGDTWEDQSANVPAGFFRSFDDVVALTPSRAVVVGGFAPAGPVGLGPVLVLLTNDGGGSWQIVPIDSRGNPTAASASLDAVCATDSGTALACGAGMLSEICLLSEDNGSTWFDISDRVIARHVACVGSATLWALRTRGTGLFQSRDRGATWSDRLAQLPDDFAGELNGIAFADEQHGWLVGEENGSPAVLHTGDGGDTWVRQSLPPGPAGTLTAVAFPDDERGVAVGLEGVPSASVALGFATTSGGQTWASAIFPPGVPGLTGIAAVP
jgi:photosystem II stability/assembly factor-like uncharacterized protein